MSGDKKKDTPEETITMGELVVAVRMMPQCECKIVVPNEPEDKLCSLCGKHKKAIMGYYFNRNVDPGLVEKAMGTLVGKVSLYLDVSEAPRPQRRRVQKLANKFGS